MRAPLLGQDRTTVASTTSVPVSDLGMLPLIAFQLFLLEAEKRMLFGLNSTFGFSGSKSLPKELKAYTVTLEPTKITSREKAKKLPNATSAIFVARRRERHRCRYIIVNK